MIAAPRISLVHWFGFAFVFGNGLGLGMRRHLPTAVCARSRKRIFRSRLRIRCALLLLLLLPPLLLLESPDVAFDKSCVSVPSDQNYRGQPRAVIRGRVAAQCQWWRPPTRARSGSRARVDCNPGGCFCATVCAGACVVVCWGRRCCRGGRVRTAERDEEGQHMYRVAQLGAVGGRLLARPSGANT